MGERCGAVRCGYWPLGFECESWYPPSRGFLLHVPLVVSRWLGESPDLTFHMLWPDPGYLSFTGGIDVPGTR